MRFLSLFSGIGGFDAGLENAGFQCVGQVENDDACLLWLDDLWPNVWRWNDVTTLSPERVMAECGPIDCIVGGFPCQDISVAGRGDGITGGRSGLWFDMLRLIAGVRPDWVIAENVPALRTRGVDIVLHGLEQAGYACWPLVVGAWAVGAPHNRNRVWIIGKRVSDSDYSAALPEQLSERSESETTISGRGSAVDDSERLGCGPGRGERGNESGAWSGRGEPIGASETAMANAERESGGCRDQEPQRKKERRVVIGGAGEGILADASRRGLRTSVAQR